MQSGYPGFGDLHFVGDLLHAEFFEVVEIEDLLGGFVEQSYVVEENFIALPLLDVTDLLVVCVGLLAVGAAEQKDDCGITDDIAQIVHACVILGEFLFWVARVLVGGIFEAQAFGLEKFVEHELIFDVEIAVNVFSFESPSGASACIEDFTANAVVGVGSKDDIVVAIEALIGF